MKKPGRWIIMMLLLTALVLTGCGGTASGDGPSGQEGTALASPEGGSAERSGEPEPNFEATQDSGMPKGQETTPGERFVDVDLTALSSTMVYGEVFNMMVAPQEYAGKIVKMAGQFSVYHDETTGKDYFAVLIMDATACCAQGIEFVLAGEQAYPQDYPPVDSEITVVGEFQPYEEDGIPYIHLIDAQFAS